MTSFFSYCITKIFRTFDLWPWPWFWGHWDSNSFEIFSRYNLWHEFQNSALPHSRVIKFKFGCSSCQPARQGDGNTPSGFYGWGVKIARGSLEKKVKYFCTVTKVWRSLRQREEESCIKQNTRKSGFVFSLFYFLGENNFSGLLEENHSDAKLHKSFSEFCLYSWFKSFGVWAMITLHERAEKKIIRKLKKCKSFQFCQW